MAALIAVVVIPVAAVVIPVAAAPIEGNDVHIVVVPVPAAFVCVGLLSPLQSQFPWLLCLLLPSLSLLRSCMSQSWLNMSLLQ